MSQSQLNLYNSNIKTHIIDAVYDSPNYRSIYELPANSVFLSNWRLAGVGQSGSATNYNYLLGSHGVIESIELMDGADTIIDQLHEFSLWNAFKALNTDVVGDLSVENFLKNNSVGQLFTGGDQTNQKGVKWQIPNSKSAVTANYDATATGWLALSDNLNFLKNSQYVPTSLFKQCRLVINWKNASQLQQNVMADNDAVYTTAPAVLIIDELTDPKRKMEIMNSWDGTEFYTMESERLSLPAITGLADTAGNTQRSQTVNYPLQGFDNKFVNRMLIIRQPTDSSTWVDPNNPTTNYGASNQSSFSAWKSKFQISLDSKPMLPFSGWTRKNQVLGQLIQTFGDLAIPPGGNMIGFQNQADYYTTPDDVIGKLDYTGIYIDNVVQDLSLQLERVGVYGSVLVSAGATVGNINPVTAMVKNPIVGTDVDVTFTNPADVTSNGKSYTMAGFTGTSFGVGDKPNGTGVVQYPGLDVLSAGTGVIGAGLNPVSNIYTASAVCLGANFGDVTPITTITKNGNDLDVTVAGNNITGKIADGDSVLLGNADVAVPGAGDLPNAVGIVSALAFGAGDTTFTLAGLATGITVGANPGLYENMILYKVSQTGNGGNDILAIIATDQTATMTGFVRLTGAPSTVGDPNGSATVGNSWYRAGGTGTKFILPGLGTGVTIGAGPALNDILIDRANASKITVVGLGPVATIAGFNGTAGKIGEEGNANEKFNQAMNLQILGEVRKSVVKAGNNYIISYV